MNEEVEKNKKCPCDCSNEHSDKKNSHKKFSINTIEAGISFGSALAMVISYVTNKSIGWAIVHGCLGWFYVIYRLIKQVF